MVFNDSNGCLRSPICLRKPIRKYYSWILTWRPWVRRHKDRMKYTNAEKLRYLQVHEIHSSPDRQNDRQSAISRVLRTLKDCVFWCNEHIEFNSYASQTMVHRIWTIDDGPKSIFVRERSAKLWLLVKVRWARFCKWHIWEKEIIKIGEKEMPIIYAA